MELLVLYNNISIHIDINVNDIITGTARRLQLARTRNATPRLKMMCCVMSNANERSRLCSVYNTRPTVTRTSGYCTDSQSHCCCHLPSKADNSDCTHCTLLVHKLYHNISVTKDTSTHLQKIVAPRVYSVCTLSWKRIWRVQKLSVSIPISLPSPTNTQNTSCRKVKRYSLHVL